jgi:citrate lyase subunit beta/citryl-CoA lyase
VRQPNKRKIEVSSDLFDIRSLLFLPASNPRAIAKARASAADLVILDLEDAVRAEDKTAARSAAVDAVAEDWPMPVAIRVNGAGTQWHSADLDAVSRCGANFAVLPRATSAHLARLAAGSVGKPTIAMIETAAGVLAAAEIAREAAALLAGTNDLAADLCLPADADRQPLQTALQMVVLAARAASIPVLEDGEGFARECRDGRGLGFDGKSLIHPSQIDPCNAAFSPSAEEVEEARRLVEAFGGGAERYEGRMIERMHVEAARRVLRRIGA